MVVDGYTLNLPDEAGNRDTFGFPVSEEEDMYTNGSWRSVIRGSGRNRRKSRGALPVRMITCRLEPEEPVIPWSRP